jgi:hypothetical protein
MAPEEGVTLLPIKNIGDIFVAGTIWKPIEIAYCSKERENSPVSPALEEISSGSNCTGRIPFQPGLSGNPRTTSFRIRPMKSSPYH